MIFAVFTRPKVSFFIFEKNCNRTAQLSQKSMKIKKKCKKSSFFLMIYGDLGVEMVCSNSFRTINSVKTRSVFTVNKEFSHRAEFVVTGVRCRFVATFS